MKKPIGLTSRAAQRASLVWVRRPRGLWLLWTASLVVAFTFSISGWVVAAMGLLGLLAAWELAGRIASSYHEVHDERLRRDRVRRAFMFFAVLAASLTYFIFALRLVAASLTDQSILTLVLILTATVVGIWLVFRIARQGWRTAYAAAALASISALGVFLIIDDLSVPEAASMGISLIRLLVVWTLAAIFAFSLSVQPSRQWRQAAWLVPVHAVSLSYVLRPPGALEGAWDVGLWWAAVGVFGVVVATILGLGILRIRKDTTILIRLFRSDDSNRPWPCDLLVVTLFLPAAAIAPLSGWTQWLLTTGFATLAAIALYGLLGRRNRSAAPRKSPGSTVPSDNAPSAGESKGPPKILTLTAV